MARIDYQPVPPARKRRTPRKAAAVAALVVLSLLGGAAWLALRERPEPPPTYYQAGALTSLEDFNTWSVYKPPGIPGPYRILNSMQPQSSVGKPLSGRIGTPRGTIPFEVPAVENASLLAVGVANPAGQYDLFVFYRVEREPGAAGPTETEP